MYKNDIVLFGLLGIGIYFIFSINNDNLTVKNSGTLQLNNDNLPSNNLLNYDVKPIDNKIDNNKLHDNNFTLGVDLNDPSNLKYKLQAPNYDNSKLNPNDLLPSNDIENNQWDFGVPQQKISLNEANLLGSATSKIGFNTQGNTLKNASTDLRGNIPNPKIQVGPFNNSSYEPDNNIKAWYN